MMPYKNSEDIFRELEKEWHAERETSSASPKLARSVKPVDWRPELHFAAPKKYTGLHRAPSVPLRKKFLDLILRSGQFVPMF